MADQEQRVERLDEPDVEGQRLEVDTEDEPEVEAHRFDRIEGRREEGD